MIESFKDLEKLLKLCRKQGVTELKLDKCEFKLGDLPIETTKLDQSEISSENPFANFPDGELTPDQLMFYSAGGRPEDDPYLKDQ